MQYTKNDHISRSKAKQAIKFGQLVEQCKYRNIFIGNSYKKCETLFPDSFLKNRKWAYFWINSLKLYTACFYWMPSWGLSKYIETKLQTTCFDLISVYENPWFPIDTKMFCFFVTVSILFSLNNEILKINLFCMNKPYFIRICFLTDWRQIQ